MEPVERLSIQPFLSEDFVFKEILPRLPAKSLMRFKSVSKSWLARISSDSTFISDHLDHRSNTTEVSNIIRARYSNDKEVIMRLFFLGHDSSKLVEIDTSYLKKVLKESSEEEVTSFVYLLGSCNGLVFLGLYCSDGSRVLMLWNPVTRDFNRLPDPTLPSIPGICSCWQGRLDEFCIGFDKDSNDYKIIRLESIETEGENIIDSAVERIIIDVQLFTKSSGRWRRLKGFCGFVTLGDGLVVNGSFYWPIIRGEAPAKSSVFRVLSFDIHNEEFKESNGPACPHDDEYEHLKLIKWKGCLGALLIKPEFKECQFWLNTKNDGWTKMFIVDPKLPHWGFGGVLRDRLILTNRDSRTAFLHDMVSQQNTELEDDLGRVFFYELFDHVHSLVSPN